MNIASDNYLKGFNHNHLIDKLPLYKVMSPLFNVCAPTCHVEVLNFLFQDNLISFSKIWQCYTQLWIDGERVIGYQIKYGLILNEEQHPLYKIYG
jgi:glutaredoxin-related protein